MELNNIYNEDCLEGMKRIPDKNIDAVITDPPYLFIKGGMKNSKLAGKMKAGSYINTSMSDFGKEQIYSTQDALAPKFKHGWNGIFFCSELQIVYYLQYAVEHELRYNVLVWDRQVRSMISRKFFRSHIDYIIRIYGKGNSLYNIHTDNDIDMYSKIRISKQGKETDHETEKPIKLISDLIQLLTDEGDVILDPFMGSGTTAIACIKQKRNYIGFEINKKYYDMSQNRIKKTPRPIMSMVKLNNTMTPDQHVTFPSRSRQQTKRGSFPNEPLS